VSEWSHDVLEELRDEGLRRIRGGLLPRILDAGSAVLSLNPARIGVHALRGMAREPRVSRAAYFTGITEAAERMNEAERAAFRANRTVPDWFWDEVERSAASWDALPE